MMKMLIFWQKSRFFKFCQTVLSTLAFRYETSTTFLQSYLYVVKTLRVTFWLFLLILDCYHVKSSRFCRRLYKRPEKTENHREEAFWSRQINWKITEKSTMNQGNRYGKNPSIFQIFSLLNLTHKTLIDFSWSSQKTQVSF